MGVYNNDIALSMCFVCCILCVRHCSYTAHAKIAVMVCLCSHSACCNKCKCPVLMDVDVYLWVVLFVIDVCVCVCVNVCGECRGVLRYV